MLGMCCSYFCIKIISQTFEKKGWLMNVLGFRRNDINVHTCITTCSLFQSVKVVALPFYKTWFQTKYYKPYTYNGVIFRKKTLGYIRISLFKLLSLY